MKEGDKQMERFFSQASTRSTNTLSILRSVVFVKCSISIYSI